MPSVEACRACGSLFPVGTSCSAKACKRPAFAGKRSSNHGVVWRSRSATKAKRAFLALPGNSRCWECSAPATVVDHIIPVSTPEGAARLMDVTNWRPHCRACSCRQGARMGGRSAALSRRRGR